MHKKIALIISVLALSACGNEVGTSDLKDWMKEQESGMKGKIEKLPPAKSFIPVAYNATIDPFNMKEKASLNDLLKDRYAPDFNRPKQALEAIPLQNLKMVGTVLKDGKYYAMIKDGNKIIYYVTEGDYMGTDYGEIKKISEGEIQLEERVKDGDEWKLKPVKIFLYEGGSK